MTEFEGRHKLDVEPIDEQRTERIAQLIAKSLYDPKLLAQITDPIELRVLEFTLPELEYSGRVRPHFNDVFAFTRIMDRFYPDSYALRMYLLSLDEQLKALFGDDYTYHAGSPDFWNDQDVFSMLDYERLSNNMTYQNQAYNNPTTYGYFDLQLNRLRYLWDRPPVVVDVGGSSGKGAQVLMMRDKYPPRPMKIYKSFKTDSNGNLVPDFEAQEQLEELGLQYEARGGALSIDILPGLSVRGGEPWVYANTFPMSEETRDPAAIELFKALNDEPRYTDKLRTRPEDAQNAGIEQPPNVCIYNHSVDALDPQSLEVLADILPGGKADFFILSGVILQWTEEQTRAALHNLSYHASENALCSLSDWAYTHRGGLSGIKVRRGNYWRTRAGFTNFLIKLHDLNKPPIRTAVFLNRRCEEAVLTEEGRQIML